jgi:hypothetical protein
MIVNVIVAGIHYLMAEVDNYNLKMMIVVDMILVIDIDFVVVVVVV